MIKITNATRSQTKAFNEREWHGVDIEHYGKVVHWDEQNFLYKATEDDEIVGTIRGKHESGVVYISTLIVAGNKRGKGIGRLLMEKAEEFAKKKGAHKMYLTTGKDWKAGKFYETLGFEKTADLPNHHFHKDFVIYSKFI